MFFLILFLILTILILSHSDVSLYYAMNGFSLWYSKMIPTLLPFMIISGILIRLNLSEKFAGILHPFLGRIYRCNKNVSYAIIIGFLCGFPMGARVISELLHAQKITKQEARFLIAFNNNIGPVYFVGYAIPLLQINNKGLALFIMYGIPLLYAFVLRRTYFKDMNIQLPDLIGETDINKNKNSSKTSALFDAVDASIQNSVQSILMLCGYMILFNVINIIPHFLIPKLHVYIAPCLEITGGLGLLAPNHPVFALCLLQFGGLSCIAQTNCMIKNTGLSIISYFFHKLVLTGLVMFFCLFMHYLLGFTFL